MNARQSFCKLSHIAVFFSDILLLLLLVMCMYVCVLLECLSLNLMLASRFTNSCIPSIEEIKKRKTPF